MKYIRNFKKKDNQKAEEGKNDSGFKDRIQEKSDRD